MARKSTRKRQPTAKVAKAPINHPESPPELPANPESSTPVPSITQIVPIEAVEPPFESIAVQIEIDALTERSITSDKEEGKASDHDGPTDTAVTAPFTSISPPKPHKVRFKWTLVSVVAMLEELNLQADKGKVLGSAVKSEAWTAVQGV